MHRFITPSLSPLWSPLLSRSGAAALLLSASVLAPGLARAAGEPVMLDVQVRLVDTERRPIARMPLRLRVGADAQRQGTGLALVTDDAGSAHANLRHVLDQRLMKVPTNFVSQLFSLPQKTVHAPLGLELEAFGQAWWWTLDIDRFADASVLHPAEFTAWPADATGGHPAPLRWRGPVDGAELPDGRRITVLPWRPAEVQFKPVDGDATRWALSLTVVRAVRPAP